jgi:hypothetical protein
MGTNEADSAQARQNRPHRGPARSEARKSEAEARSLIAINKTEISIPAAVLRLKLAGSPCMRRSGADRSTFYKLWEI